MQVPKYWSEGSPLAHLIHTLNTIADNRRLIGGAFGASGGWRVFLEDVAMMLGADNLVIGLRDAWLRRVAVPVLMAHRELCNGRGDNATRGRAAIEILGQCQDLALRDKCATWIHTHIITPPATPAPGDGDHAQLVAPLQG